MKQILVKYLVYYIADYVYYDFFYLFLHSLFDVSLFKLHFIMIQNIFYQGDFYRMILNLPHRRLIVLDEFPFFQKRVYSSIGCLLKRCPFSFTCDMCSCSYDVSDL